MEHLDNTNPYCKYRTQLQAGVVQVRTNGLVYLMDLDVAGHMYATDTVWQDQCERMWQNNNDHPPTWSPHYVHSLTKAFSNFCWPCCPPRYLWLEFIFVRVPGFVDTTHFSQYYNITGEHVLVKLIPHVVVMDHHWKSISSLKEAHTDVRNRVSGVIGKWVRFRQRVNHDLVVPVIWRGYDV